MKLISANVLSSVLAVTVAAACGSGTPSPAACAPGDNSWPATFDLSGSYTVTMTADVGEHSGESVTGSMSLHAVDVPAGEATGYRVEYAGSADIEVEDVGALEMGSIRSEDPEMPGVVVQVHRTGEQVNMLVRFGSEANRTDRTRFDGGYTVFRVSGMTGDNLSGTWTSGISRTDASGSFCAVKT